MSSYQLKNIYSPTFIDNLSQILLQVIPEMVPQDFIQAIFDESWKERALKERMHHIAVNMHRVLDADYKKAATQLIRIAEVAQEFGFKVNNLEFIFLPDYIETYGLEDIDTSVATIEIITQFVSCEFAVRPFYIRYEEKMLDTTLEWAKHPHPHVRRLASEGCRPRLPWAMALPAFKKAPQKILPILDVLKNDAHEWVRRSVANNLNDIAKDHPEVVVDLSRQWLGASKEQDWVVRHGCRTLLKKGNKEILALFGLSYHDKLQLQQFKILTPIVKIGEYLEFSFDIENHSSKQENIRIEYALYYMKANGKQQPKVFKISEKYYPPKSVQMVHRRQSFKRISTRKFHVGMHRLAIIINGKEFHTLSFELVE